MDYRVLDLSAVPLINRLVPYSLSYAYSQAAGCRGNASISRCTRRHVVWSRATLKDRACPTQTAGRRRRRRHRRRRRVPALLSPRCTTNTRAPRLARSRTSIRRPSAVPSTATSGRYRVSTDSRPKRSTVYRGRRGR